MGILCFFVGHTWGYLGIPGDTTFFWVGIPGDTWGYLGIPGDTWGYLEVPIYYHPNPPEWTISQVDKFLKDSTVGTMLDQD